MLIVNVRYNDSGISSNIDQTVALAISGNVTQGNVDSFAPVNIIKVTFPSLISINLLCNVASCEKERYISGRHQKLAYLRALGVEKS